MAARQRRRRRRRRRGRDKQREREREREGRKERARNELDVPGESPAPRAQGVSSYTANSWGREMDERNIDTEEPDGGMPRNIIRAELTATTKTTTTPPTRVAAVLFPRRAWARFILPRAHLRQAHTYALECALYFGWDQSMLRYWEGRIICFISILHAFMLVRTFLVHFRRDYIHRGERRKEFGE